MAERILELINFEYYYGGIYAVKNISMRVESGEMVALIGVNGAGKTTVLQSISGALPGRRGQILFDGKDITRMKAHAITRLGISHVLEGRHVFTQLSVEENLDMGCFLRKDKKGIQQDKAEMFELFPRLEERKNQLAGTLSGGEQQMLAIARALLTKPKILLLDEPSLGLAPLIVKEIFQIIKKIRKTGLTILLVEQNSRLALQASDRAYIMDTGNIVLEDCSAALLENEVIRKTYLGED